jgi:hypothetical protein
MKSGSTLEQVQCSKIMHVVAFSFGTRFNSVQRPTFTLRFEFLFLNKKKYIFHACDIPDVFSNTASVILSFSIVRDRN